MKVKFKPGDVAMVVDNIETSYRYKHSRKIGSLIIVAWAGTINEIPTVTPERGCDLFPDELENLGPL